MENKVLKLRDSMPHDKNMGDLVIPERGLRCNANMLCNTDMLCKSGLSEVMDLTMEDDRYNLVFSSRKPRHEHYFTLALQRNLTGVLAEFTGHLYFEFEKEIEKNLEAGYKYVWLEEYV